MGVLSEKEWVGDTDISVQAEFVIVYPVRHTQVLVVEE